MSDDDDVHLDANTVHYARNVLSAEAARLGVGTPAGRAMVELADVIDSLRPPAPAPDPATQRPPAAPPRRPGRIDGGGGHPSGGWDMATGRRKALDYLEKTGRGKNPYRLA